MQEAAFPQPGAASAPRVSIIIPTYNERSTLPSMVSALRSLSGSYELVFTDGDSTDGTREWLVSNGLRVIRAPRGRGSQLAAGASASKAPVLWFIHADCLPDPAALGVIETAVGNGAIAGYCRLLFRDGGAPARCMNWLYPRLARFGLVYGDAAIFVTRSAYLSIGGIQPWPLFEDLDLIFRLRRFSPSAIQCVDAVVRPSARRFRGLRFPLVFAQWAILQCLFFAGVPPHWLARSYQPVRG